MDQNIMDSAINKIQKWWKIISVEKKFLLFSYVITSGLKNEKLNDNVFLIVGKPKYTNSIRIPVKHWSSTRNIYVDMDKVDTILLIKPTNLLNYKKLIQREIISKTTKLGLTQDFTFEWFNFPNRKPINQSIGMKPIKVCGEDMHYSTIEHILEKKNHERSSLLQMILQNSSFNNQEDEIFVKGICLICSLNNDITWIQACNFLDMNKQIEDYSLKNQRKILMISPEHQLFIRMYVLAIGSQRGGETIPSDDPKLFHCLFWCKTDYLRLDSHLTLVNPIKCIKLFINEIIECKHLTMEQQKTECSICFEEKEKYLCNSCSQCNKFVCFSCYNKYLDIKEKDLLCSSKKDINITCPSCRNVNAKLVK